MPIDEKPMAVVPLKVNAFEHLRSSNSQLSALFPYLHPGAIVPCTSQFEIVPENPLGYFVHENSVDEVGMILGSDGRGRVGDVWCGPRRHGVGFSAPHPFYSATVITQRQMEAGEQPEAVILLCEKCSEPIVHHEFSGATDEDGVFPPLPTTVGSCEAAMLAATPEQRTCKACGHVNAEFPLDTWGWHRYVQNTRIARNAYKALKEAIS
ncbi:hypothetical protein [Pusillimonas sp.]|uniref:hypothetical protein n=1 Tax=Pusillimonas sp. TaxID=3040095 RepID=UPI0029A82A47|nr:hypothetical protein [Pusillimonas sp.]MDX3895448.1 hypothetical protein [Pusillimonas sp.]